MKVYYLILIVFSILLAGCDSGTNYAPVSEVSSIERVPRTGVHRVARGETLYSIAWRYGLDYRAVAKRNNIDPPYTVIVGQKIYLQGHPQTTTRTLPTQQPVQRAASDREPNFSITQWLRPAKGRIIRTFSGLNKGINIAGHEGEPIYAAAPGKIVYAGDGLRSYGNLIIIKHNSTFLSAYAHNNKIYVKEGEWVKQGQKIAEMGDTGTSRVILHFEIRKAGQPIDPLPFIR